MSGNGSGLEWRVSSLESRQIVTVNDIAELTHANRVQADTIQEIRQLCHDSLAKLNVVENLLHMLRESLYTPEHKRKKTTVVRKLKEKK